MKLFTETFFRKLLSFSTIIWVIITASEKDIFSHGDVDEFTMLLLAPVSIWGIVWLTHPFKEHISRNKQAYYKIWKWTKVLLIIGIMTALGIIFYNEYPPTKINATASYNLDSCTKTHPMLVQVYNDSFRTVDQVKFEIRVTEQGSDTIISKFTAFAYDSPYSLNRVIKPNSSLYGCWSYPGIQSTSYRIDDEYKSSLNYNIAIRRVTFQ